MYSFRLNIKYANPKSGDSQLGQSLFFLCFVLVFNNLFKFESGAKRSKSTSGQLAWQSLHLLSRLSGLQPARAEVPAPGPNPPAQRGPWETGEPAQARAPNTFSTRRRHRSHLDNSHLSLAFLLYYKLHFLPPLKRLPRPAFLGDGASDETLKWRHQGDSLGLFAELFFFFLPGCMCEVGFCVTSKDVAIHCRVVEQKVFCLYCWLNVKRTSVCLTGVVR